MFHCPNAHSICSGMQIPRTLNQEWLSEGDQVTGMNIVLDVVDEFDGQIMETEGWHFFSKSNTYQGYPCHIFCV